MAALPHAALGCTGRTDGWSIEVDRMTAPARELPPARIRFSVIGTNHPDICSQVTAVQRGGGELAAVYAKANNLLAEFVKRVPGARVARSEDEILDDTSIQPVLTSGIPDERAPVGIRVMQRGKDFMPDKPGMTSLEPPAEVRHPGRHERGVAGSPLRRVVRDGGPAADVPRHLVEYGEERLNPRRPTTAVPGSYAPNASATSLRAATLLAPRGSMTTGAAWKRPLLSATGSGWRGEVSYWAEQYPLLHFADMHWLSAEHTLPFACLATHV